MKTLVCLGLSGIAFMTVQPVTAQSVPCGGTETEVIDIQGAATFEDTRANENCRGPAVDTSFGPFPLMSTITVVSETLPMAVREVPEPGQEADNGPTVEQEAGGIRQDFNGQQMRRLGELDARQGRPLNMMYADDLSYLQGYTQGQKTRRVVPGQLPYVEPRRGFVGF